jgi:agmatine/peptidylarginine deiminase
VRLGPRSNKLSLNKFVCFLPDRRRGHIDAICRFVGLSAILTAIEPKTKDPNHEPLSENLAQVFPDCEVIGIRGVDRICGLGALRCMPAVTRS